MSTLCPRRERARDECDSDNQPLGSPTFSRPHLMSLALAQRTLDNVMSSLGPARTWQLRIGGQSAAAGPQTVYYLITKYVPCI
jgi:hypothetical protein